MRTGAGHDLRHMRHVAWGTVVMVELALMAADIAPHLGLTRAPGEALEIATIVLMVLIGFCAGVAFGVHWHVEKHTTED